MNTKCRQTDQLGPKNHSHTTPIFIRWPSHYRTDLSRKKQIGKLHFQRISPTKHSLRVYYSVGNADEGIYLQMTENGTSFVRETTFDSFPLFQRIHNNDETFSLKAKNSDQFVTWEDCTKFTLQLEQGLVSACDNKLAFDSGKSKNAESNIDEGSTHDNRSPHDDRFGNIPISFLGLANQLRFYVLLKTYSEDDDAILFIYLVDRFSLVSLDEKLWNGSLPDSQFLEGPFQHHLPLLVAAEKSSPQSDFLDELIKLHQKVDEKHVPNNNFEKLLEVNHIEQHEDGIVIHDKRNNSKYCREPLDLNEGEGK